MFRNRKLDIRIESATASLREYLLLRSLRKRRTTFAEFRRTVLGDPHYRPIFFLSTGRTCTGWFSELLNRAANIKSFHGPMPRLQVQGRRVFDCYLKRHVVPAAVVGELYLSAREDILYRCYLHDLRYAETNNSITYLAHGIKAVLPHARFVHLRRHPGGVIRSGLRRGWYGGSDPGHDYRPSPSGKDPTTPTWSTYSVIEKIAWYWNATNSFIEDFVQACPDATVYQMGVDELTTTAVGDLLRWLEVEISPSAVRQSITRPVNVEQRGACPEYHNWPHAEKASVRRICGELCTKYGYVLD